MLLEMKAMKEYTIPFVGLKLGKHRFDYTIDNAFFAFFDFDEFNAAEVEAELLLNKKNTLLELDFRVWGSVNLNCDVSNEAYDQPIDNELSLMVKFGEEFNEVNEELLILPHGEYQIEVQQYIYEAIVLAVPAKRVHPKVKDGSMDLDILKKLEALRPKSAGEKTKAGETDPRWNKLKELLNDKKP